MAEALATGISARAPVALETSWRENLVAALLGVWAVLGLFLDGWAHHTRPELESFFTPWHGVLYSGAAAGAGWLAILIARRRAGGRSWREAVPPGYGLALIGGVGFGAAGVADMAWHTIFGVEVAIEALLSPSHLLLLLSGLLTLSAPLRASWLAPGAGGDAAGPRRPDELLSALPAVISLTSTTAVVFFFFHYLSPLQESGAVTATSGGPAAASGLAGIFLTNLILVAPLLFFITRIGTPPMGTATLLYIGVAALVSLETDFSFPAAVPVALAIGLAIDGLLRAIGPSVEVPWRHWLAAAAVPLALWSGYFLAVELAVGIAWTPELWSGAIFMAALSGLGLGLLSVPGASGARAEA